MNIKQLHIFLNTMEFIKGSDGAFKYQNNINLSLKAYEERKDKKGAGMSTFFLLRETTFTMFGWESKHNKAYDVECKLFEKAMDKANIKKCHVLELDLRRQRVVALNMKVKHCAWIHCKKDCSEYQVCSGCDLARYCCRDHQKRHWNQFHRYCCKK